jgi:hypothetical protein
MARHLQAPSGCSHPVCEHRTYDTALSAPLTGRQGFFQSLFTAGFEESASIEQYEPRELDIVFEDRNITRAGTYAMPTRPMRL